MNDKQRRRCERLVRCQDSATTHINALPPNSVGGKALAGIANRIEEIENLDAARSTQQRAAEQGMSSRSAARAS